MTEQALLGTTDAVDALTSAWLSPAFRPHRTFGKLQYVPSWKEWVVECDAHVAIKLKRFFKGIDPRQFGKQTIADTLENCRDLLWFMQRYPFEMPDATRELLERRANEAANRAADVHAILTGHYMPPDFEMALPPREYQKIAAAMARSAGGLLVADDVGLGKTVTSLCLLADKDALPALVVTLTHLPHQWELEIERFLPGLRTHVLKKGQPYRLTGKRGRKKGAEQTELISTFPDVLISNYHKLSGWAETLAGTIRTVIFDEIQELRHAGSQKYAAATHIAEKASLRMGLSATPIYNYGEEIYSVLNITSPGSLGHREEFKREWCLFADYSGKARIREPKAFGSFAREAGLMIRRTRSDVGRELAALTKVPHYIDANTAELERVGDAAAELARVILAQGEQYRGQKMQASEALSNLLRQTTGIAKAPFVADFVRMLVESGEKVLLYGWHREVYSIWLDKLKDLRPRLFTGTESPKQKEESRQAFLQGPERGTDLLIMSLRSGAGIDGLQHKCRTVVFGELDWSPGVHEQCIGRIHRDGQPDPVVAYFLVSDFGADPTMMDVLGVKRTQIQGIRDPNASLIETLDTGGAHIRKLAEDLLRQRGGTHA